MINRTLYQQFITLSVSALPVSLNVMKWCMNAASVCSKDVRGRCLLGLAYLITLRVRAQSTVFSNVCFCWTITLRSLGLWFAGTSSEKLQVKFVYQLGIRLKVKVTATNISYPCVCCFCCNFECLGLQTDV